MANKKLLPSLMKIYLTVSGGLLMMISLCYIQLDLGVASDNLYIDITPVWPLMDVMDDSYQSGPGPGQTQST